MNENVDPRRVMLPSLEDFTSGNIKTLGWEVLAWGSAMLGQPDGEYKGQSWEYTPEQALFILRFYAVDDEGRFLYRRAVLERVKGWGKSPLVAAICCTECFGPVRFDGWNADGEPVGAPAYSPLVQIAAISDSQADNTMVLVGEMLAEGEAANIRGIDILLSKVTAPGQRKIEKVTASPRGREGNRATFVVMDETHLWVPAEKGPELAAALRRNAAKMGARTIETTNAHVPGEMSVAENSYNAFLEMMAGGTYDTALLFDSREVHVDDIYDKNKAVPALLEAYGDAAKERGGWVDIERIFAEVCDPNVKEHEARRFYFNEKTEGKSTWISENDWKNCYNEAIHLDIENDIFALGFKGAVRNGAAALVACRLTDNALFLLGLWEKPEHAPMDWEVPYADVDARIRNLLKMEICFKLVADPEHWQEVLGRMYADYPEKVEEFWLTKNRGKAAKAIEQFETAAKSKRLQWADPNLSKHILACHTLETPQGTIIRKETEKSKRYISAAQAAVLALEAAMLSVEEGALNSGSSFIYSF